MAQIQRKAGILVCTEAFWVGNELIPTGATIREGHPIIKGREQFFKPQETADIEE
jgi:hypothetical protein